MKGSQINVGRIYLALVSGKIARVRVESKDASGVRFGSRGAARARWLCTNLGTGRAVVVKSAQRFRSLAPDCLGHAPMGYPKGSDSVAPGSSDGGLDR